MYRLFNFAEKISGGGYISKLFIESISSFKKNNNNKILRYYSKLQYYKKYLILYSTVTKNFFFNFIYV